MMDWISKYNRVVVWTAVSLFVLLMMLIAVQFPDPPEMRTPKTETPSPQPTAPTATFYPKPIAMD